MVTPLTLENGVEMLVHFFKVLCKKRLTKFFSHCIYYAEEGNNEENLEKIL